MCNTILKVKVQLKPEISHLELMGKQLVMSSQVMELLFMCDIKSLYVRLIWSKMERFKTTYNRGMDGEDDGTSEDG